MVQVTPIQYYFASFKVAEKSSGYTLIISGYPDTIITDNLKPVEFPTSLPNSSFKNMGDTLNISDKGSIKILDFFKDPNSDNVVLRFELSNASGGYDQNFHLGFIFVGNDGIFRCLKSNSPVLAEGASFMGDYPKQWVVGPGKTNLCFVKANIPIDVKNIKLIITGDIDTVINLD